MPLSFTKVDRLHGLSPSVSLFSIMETFNLWSSLQGYALFMFLLMINEGSSCEPPSPPLCYRRNSLVTVYICEWNQTGEEKNATYDLHFRLPGAKTFHNITTSWVEIVEEQLITVRPIDVWVQVHVGNSSCMSATRSTVLGQAVKFPAPENIKPHWMQDNLTLSWNAAEMFPALAEIWFRRDNIIDTWNKTKTNTTVDASKYRNVVGNLHKDSSYQVQIRHQSTQVKDPLWSDWSPVVFVPAELDHEPKVKWTSQPINGTRKVTLSWKSVPQAASVRGIHFILNDTQSSLGCPCERQKGYNTTHKKYTIYVSYSAVNISVVAENDAGRSPPATVQLPAELPRDIKACDRALFRGKLKKKMCLQWYELDADLIPRNGKTLSGQNKKGNAQIENDIQNYTRYLYFEQRCQNRKPHTVKMCFFYREEGTPNKEPQGFMAFSETQTSVNLSWVGIPMMNQRGFLTHFNVCSVKSNSQDEPQECHIVSASETTYRLENLTPGTKYSISLAGATGVGEGPQATVTVNTKPEKPVNLWLSFGLLIIFFLFTIMCTAVFKRIKNKILPPVPSPFIQNLTSHRPDAQDMTEHKEEVNDLMLLQLHPENRTICEETEVTIAGGQWEERSDEDTENDESDSGGSDDQSLSASSTHDTRMTTREGEVTDLEQMDNELAIMTYRNDLVFDAKTDSS